MEDHKLSGYVNQESALKGTFIDETQEPLLTNNMLSTFESNTRVLPDSYITVNSDGMAVDCRVSKCSGHTSRHANRMQRYAGRMQSWIDSINSEHLIMGGTCSWALIILIIMFVFLYRSNKN